MRTNFPQKQNPFKSFNQMPSNNTMTGYNQMEIKNLQSLIPASRSVHKMTDTNNEYNLSKDDSMNLLGNMAKSVIESLKGKNKI